MNDRLRNSIKANLFPAAIPAVEPWDEFPWHLDDRTKECDTWKPHSSQALAIDVFGTLKAVDGTSRDRVLDALCEKLQVQTGGPWQVHLEWCDPKNLLKETRPTQVDAVAEGRSSLIFFEVKFTEKLAGCCSQPRPLPNGEHSGAIQCNGNYDLQINPINGTSARCALSGKGIRYWDFIPQLFRLDPGGSHIPCPFARENYQWMRNIVLCEANALATGRQARFVVAHVNDDRLAMKRYKNGTDWAQFLGMLNSGTPQPFWLDLLEMTGTIEHSLPAWIQSKLDRLSRGDG